MNLEIGDNLVLVLSLVINAVLVPLVAKYHNNCTKLKAKLGKID